ncbi:MAG: invasion associated locus B family protein [Kiloniellales bacterium]
MAAMLTPTLRPLASAFALALLGFAIALPAVGQGIERLGDFGDWTAFRSNDGSTTTCYIASQPKRAEGDYSQRGEIYALVSHRPAEKRKNEVSIIAGYQFQTDSWVDVSIDDQDFRLFTQKDTAWTPDQQTDEAMVQAMIKGRQMVVKGTSSRGTLTTDTYSLSGFTRAHRTIDKACGI